MIYYLGTRSKKKLLGVHPDLVAVVKIAIKITDVDFSVLEGFRILRRQKHLVKTGASTTLNSRHLTGHAVDLGAYIDRKINWEWKYYEIIADAMKAAAKKRRIHILWGGDWVKFQDGGHFELDWSDYPKRIA